MSNDLCPFCGGPIGASDDGFAVCKDGECRGRSGWHVVPGKGLQPREGGAAIPPGEFVPQTPDEDESAVDLRMTGPGDTVLVRVTFQGQQVILPERAMLAHPDQGESGVRAIAQEAWDVFERVGGVSLMPRTTAWLSKQEPAGALAPIDTFQFDDFTGDYEIPADAPIPPGDYSLADYVLVQEKPRNVGPTPSSTQRFGRLGDAATHGIAEVQTQERP